MSIANAATSFLRRTVVPAAKSVGRFFDRGWRRLAGRKRPSEDQSLLPLVIQVLAAFSKSEGEVVEEEVDAVLGLLRHGYPGGVYSDLRRQFRDALSLPLILLGGINRLATVHTAMADGFEFVAMARSLLREPDLIHRWQDETGHDGLCVHCNKCMPSIYQGTHCVLVAPSERPGHRV